MVVANLIAKQAENISLACPGLKRLGFWGFLFFFVKGLLWLAVPSILLYFSAGS